MAASAKKGFRMRAMTVLLSGEIVDDAGAKMTPTGLDVDGAYTAGDLRGWPNGTVVGSNGVVLLLVSVSPTLLVSFSYASPMLLLCFSYASPMLLLCFLFAFLFALLFGTSLCDSAAHFHIP
ncbi:unnamed protein product [Closterium sp. NIES-64]|nr:unnamed protein product [Closterium sp. NIES-64]